MCDQHRPHRRQDQRDRNPAAVVELRRGDRLLHIARALAGEPDATAARAERIDHRGFDLAIDTPNGERRTRVAFDATPAEDEFPAGVRACARAAGSPRPHPTGHAAGRAADIVPVSVVMPLARPPQDEFTAPSFNGAVTTDRNETCPSG